MLFMRPYVLILLTLNIMVRVIHVRSKENPISDSLSRLQVAKTRVLPSGAGSKAYPSSGKPPSAQLEVRLSYLVGRAYTSSTVNRYQFRCNSSAAFCGEQGESSLPTEVSVIGKFLGSLFYQGYKPA